MAYITRTDYEDLYKGFKVPAGNEFDFYAERATDKINANIADTLEAEEVTDNVKKCVSAIVDLLYTMDNEGPELKSEKSGKYSRTLNVSEAKSLDMKVYKIMTEYLTGTRIMNRGVYNVY